MLGDLFEGAVCRGKDGIVGFGAIQLLHEIWEVADGSSKLGCIFALGDHFPDGLIGLVSGMLWVMRAFAWRTTMRWTAMGRAVVRWPFEEIQFIVDRV